MAATAALISSCNSRSRSRTVLVTSADGSFRQRLNAMLTGLRWQVREAQGGAEAWGEAMDMLPQAIIVDSWLPDLDIAEFLREFRATFPNVDVITAGCATPLESAPGPHRQEILYALRRIQETDTAAWNTAPILDGAEVTQPPNQPAIRLPKAIPTGQNPCASEGELVNKESHATTAAEIRPQSSTLTNANDRILELIGNSSCMLEISRRIRLVAPRSTPVLIEGPTGSGKELVAEAIHKLSARNRKTFVAINCAAIPEALLEAELFGHTRGAFTGAVKGRVGRIEAADGGTLFLDEIGEMPLALQAKLLRFVECGELQRVGDNELLKVDVRIIAATHQALAQQTQAGGFRADLYYRLAVFLIRTPPLAEHIEDLQLLVDHFVEQMGRAMPVKRIDAAAMAKLLVHPWPGNVRELEHVLERAAILAGDEAILTAEDIDFGMPISSAAFEQHIS
ncbi:sigma-54 dependent transcriptional regulator [Telmatobacter sp. DSM 110680]|uniref:Sigma-54 dependent transcriptional regulator n=1 Tax=Telmatobacter sp. DSM 110680 TaxID=3036704 RepID=A0AAU7DF58_9BACT